MLDPLETSTPALFVGMRQRYHKLRLALATLDGKSQMMRERRADLEKATALALARIEMAPLAAQAFDALQRRAHARSVGAFEDLLSAFVQDVFPDRGRVHLALSTERGAPALDISIETDAPVTPCGAAPVDASTEDILTSTGGAVTSVIAAGLIYAARSRTQTRALVVLDEADHWLKPDRVPAFTKVLSDTAVLTGTQTLLISHHAPALFAGDAALICLTRHADDGPVSAAQLRIPETSWRDSTHEGLRWIEYEDFRTHASTRIDLFPGVNVLCGDNDLGKSHTFVSALRAVAYNESDDSVIRRGCAVARLRIGLENGIEIHWERTRKGAPKVMYRVLQHGVRLHEGRPDSRGTAPEWVTKYLRIQRVDGLDIQLRSQKMPLFLLPEAPSTRAQLLSVGRESSYLAALIAKQKEWLRKDRDLVARNAAEIAQLSRKLAALEPITGLSAVDEMLESMLDQLENTEKFERAMQLLMDRLTRYGHQVEQLSSQLATLSHLPAQLPGLGDPLRLSKLIQKIESATRVAAFRVPALPTELPQLHDQAGLEQKAKAIARAARVAGIRVPVLPAGVPSLHDQPRLEKLAAQIKRGVAVVSTALPCLPADAPATHDLKPLRELGSRIKKLQRLADLAALLPAQLPEVPALHAPDKTLKCATALTELRQTDAKLGAEHVLVSQQFGEARAVLDGLFAEMGGVCPLCESAIGGRHPHTLVAA